MIDDRGVGALVDDARALALDFRRRIQGLPIAVPEFRLSNAATPLLFPDGSAHQVFDELCSRYDFVLTPNGGDLADRMLRVGHLGNHTLADNAALAEALCMVTHVD